MDHRSVKFTYSIYLYFVCRIYVAVTQQITIFELPNRKGKHDNVNISGCANLPIALVRNVASINIQNHCTRLYDDINCFGNFIDIYPSSPSHNDLKYWNFTGKTVSAGPCSEQLKILNSYCQNVENTTQAMLHSEMSIEKVCLTKFPELDCAGQGSDVMLTPNFTLNSETKSIKRCSDKKIIISTLTTTISPNAEQNQSLTEKVISIKGIDTMPNRTLTDSSFQGNVSTDKHETKSQQTNNVLSGLPGYTIMILIVVPVASVLLSIFVISCVLRRWISYKQVMNKLSDKEIREFLGGFEMDALANAGNTTIGNEYSTELLAQNKPYNKEYEIGRSRIEFDSDVPLGKGEFGVVYKGTVAVVNETKVNTSSSHRTTDRITVAIKMINSSSGLHGLRSLLKEVKVMLYVGQHVNIARIIGCCTDNLRQGEIMVLTEFCSEGSLESFFSKHRHLYNNFVTNGRLEFQDESDTLNLISKNFDIFQLAKWCAEIASGMEFLSNAKVVHSDLAARNILLNEMLEAKISDFGLSRQLYNYTQYMKKQQEPLPWRWMAIESLKCLEFSTKSDVWSYGVLTWEIFTLGEKPYPNLGWNETFVSTLENGFRLSQPQYSTKEFYHLMHRCWEENPKNRPSFSEILTEIHDLTLNYDAIRLIPCKIENICIQIN